MTDRELRLVADLGTAFYFRAAGPEGQVWLSAGFFEVTGVADPPPPGWSWTDALHPDDRAEFAERWTRARAAGARLDTDVRLIRTDGRDHWYRLRAAVVSSALEGGHPCWVGVGLDLGEQSRAAGRAGDLATEFLATASHELRTPLNAIAGWIHVLKLHAHDDLPQWQALTAIERNVLAEKVLIDDLLDVSRLARGAMSIVPARIDLASLVKGCVANAAAAVTAKRIGLEVEVPPEPVMITADRAKLEQVVWHLLANAIRSTTQPGLVRVQVGHDPLRAWLRLTDSGEGIDALLLPYVFEPFSQRPRIAARAGLGLGLTIVRALVELHGGSVSAASEGQGQGAVFELTLPKVA